MILLPLMPLGLWQSVHIDDLRRSRDIVSDMTALQNLTISQIFCADTGKRTGELMLAVPARGVNVPEEGVWCLVLVELLSGTT